MNEAVKQAILDKIKAYDTIIISRHVRPDGDAVGSTMGLARILRLSFPKKRIMLDYDDKCEYVSFLGEEEAAVTDEMYDGALLIVIDTGTIDRISNHRYTMAKEIIKIDHHVDTMPYGDISWVEDTRSSACELIVDFYMTYAGELKLDREAALCLYTGMVTDSGRFRYDGTTGDTLRCAATLLDMGIDTETLFAHLYLEDFDYLKYESYVFDRMKRSENGVAYVYVDREMQEKFGLTTEQASNTVSTMSEIKGSIIWIAFIEYPDMIRVRLRSRFVTCNELAGRYGGGGHPCASGATVYSWEEAEKLICEADEIVREYKANNFYL